MPSVNGTGAQARDGLTPPAIRAQLDTILASEIFSRSQQLRRFLSFIVEQTLAEQGHTLKESVLAHELYGKGTDFDGGADPVVRVDARRLRDKLREYYESSSDPIVISLPKGSYVPVFEANPKFEIEPPSPIVVPTPRENRPVATLVRGKTWVTPVALLAIVAAAAITWNAFRGSEDAPVQLLPLASLPGIEGEPALSPDGELVAFSWAGEVDGGPGDIYVKAVGSEALRRLTDTASNELSPAWSPDGHTIAFLRPGEGIFTMSQLGGAERRVSTTGTWVTWADPKSVLIRDREGTTGPFGIDRVFIDTLERRRLTKAPVGAGDWRFQVSPDGETVALIRYERPGIADLYVMPTSGGEPRRLSDWNATLMGLAWTPDGREIVYSVEETAASRLWRIDANAATPGRGSPIAGIPVTARLPSISRPRSGQPARLAFQTQTIDVDIQMLDLEAGAVNDAIEARPFANSTRVEASAKFSPDGRRIAFASQRSGNQEVWIAGRDGGGLRQVTSLNAQQLLVFGWSPDGERILFDAAVDGNSDVYTVGTDGGQIRRLTSEPSIDGVPSWSNDGRWIYFSSTRAGAIPDAWRVSPDGGAAQRITHNGGFEPKESPDGQYLFYLAGNPHGLGTDPRSRLMRRPVAGGPEETVLEHVRPFLWSVIESGIVFLTREADFDAIDRYRFSDQRVARIGRLGFRVPTSYTHMSVSRDGRWALATRMVRVDSDLMRLDNFR